MTHNEKELLLKDLCARLPYGIKIEYNGDVRDLIGITLGRVSISKTFNDKDVEDIKPYLFPLSSMTEEQIYNNPIGFCQMTTILANRDWERITIEYAELCKLIDWFNKNHFDWRGLIEKGLAIDATGLNIY